LLDFQVICKESKIITLCMPAHVLHLLQPLDVGCFSLLKHAYGTEINSFVYNYINYIDKLSFLIAFKTAFDHTFTKANICTSFQGAGLVPFNPEAVLSKLNVKLHTPTPPVVDNTP